MIPDDEITVLVVDDEESICRSLEKIFSREGYRVLTAGGGREALEAVRRQGANVVLADLMMPGMDGQELLRAVKKISPEIEVVIMTAYGTVEKAVEAMKEGAYDFITKPLKRVYITKTVRQALEKQSLWLENRRLRARLEALADGQVRIVGQAPSFRRALETVHQAAPSAATVLIVGESGTGKELVARTIHERSPRAGKPFIAVNCAALPEGILESEIFGYERGAFTGAVGRKPGRLEMAGGGTLFLDEVGEMRPSMQVKLLRALEEGEVMRLGGTEPIKVDFRLVCATNKNLEEEVRAGRFREDLYYRINVISVRLPSLRGRREDIPLLADYFLRQSCQRNDKQLEGISPEAMDLLCNYGWPGNLRELGNTIERAVVLARGKQITPVDVPESLYQDTSPPAREVVFPVGSSLAEVERVMIHETLKHTRGDKKLASSLLGIAARTIYRKLEGS